MTSVILKQLPSSSTNQTRSLSAKGQAQWSPYNVNEGTALAVAGADFAIVCGDTRMSDGYTILSRQQPKIFKLYDDHTISYHIIVYPTIHYPPNISVIPWFL